MVEQIPIHPSTDFDRTEQFYATLGFGDAVRHGSEYLIMKHPSGLEMHFFPLAKINTKKNFHGAYVRFDQVGEVEALHEAWTIAAVTKEFKAIAGAAGRVAELRDTDYGLREFAMLDPDGSLLRVGGPLPDPSAVS